MKRLLSTIVMILLATWPALTSRAAPPALGVEPFRVETQDAHYLHPFYLHERGPRLCLTMLLSGPAMPNLRSYGRWQIVEARDNTGADLRPKDKDDIAENQALQPFNAAWSGADNAFAAQVYLATPSPGATKIARLRGSFTIYTGGQRAIVTIPQIRAHAGQTLSDPVLDAAGLTIEVGQVEDGKPKTLVLNLHGNLGALQGQREPSGALQEALQIVDAHGHVVGKSAGGSFSTRDQQRLDTQALTQPLDATMALRVHVTLRQQSATVPFDLRPVPLLSARQLAMNDALLQVVRQPDEDHGKTTPAQVLARVRTLLAQGADVNARENDGDTALYHAVHDGDAALVKLLLARGINPNLAGYQLGYTPLHTAISGRTGGYHTKNYQDIALLLLQKGAAVNARSSGGVTPLMSAAFDGDLRVARALLARGAQVNPQDEQGYSALMLALEERHEEIAALLLAHGAAVDIQSKDGNTALLLAADYLLVKSVSLLLAHGAQVNVHNNEGRTPLLQAVSDSGTFPKESGQIARMLLAKGAHVNVPDKKGNTPLSSAKYNGNTALIRLLRRAGATQ